MAKIIAQYPKMESIGSIGAIPPILSVLGYWAITVGSKRLEHECRMIRAGIPSLLGLVWEDGHAPNFLASTVIWAF